MKQTPIQKYGRARDCAARYGVAISTWWRWLKEGRIPQPCRLGDRVLIWELDQLDRILTEKEKLA